MILSAASVEKIMKALKENANILFSDMDSVFITDEGKCITIILNGEPLGELARGIENETTRLEGDFKCVVNGKYITISWETSPAEIPTLDYDNMIDVKVLSLLESSFPNEHCVSEGFNHLSSVDFNDGRYGVCGLSNGDCEIDVYKTFKEMQEGKNALYSCTVARVEYPKRGSDA